MILLISLANAGAATASAASDPTLLPAWLQAIAAVLALVTTATILISLNNYVRETPVAKKKEFAKAIRGDVNTHTETVNKLLFAKLQQHPTDMESMRTLLRNLRNDLSVPLEYIDSMNHPRDWPTHELNSAYLTWAGAVRALHRIIDDLHHEMIYPLVNEPVRKQREDHLLRQYIVDEKVLLRGVDAVKDAAKKLDGLAAKIIDPPSSKPI